MEPLFVVVAELLLIPLILWGLIVLELTVGVLASITAVLLGRRSPSEAMVYRWRAIRRRLKWSVIFLTAGLLLADLVFFDALINLALGSANDREDLEVSFTHAEGSFILGRIELDQFAISGARGGADPSARFDLRVDELIIDVDTLALLSADFAVEEIALDGVRASYDRLAPSPRRPRPGEGLELARDFTVERMHVGDLSLTLRDHTRDPLREVVIELAELDMGPLSSETAVFDLLYRTRGRGSVAGHAFTLTSAEIDGAAQTTLEVPEIPLDALGEQLERAAGVRATGRAELKVTNRYIEGPPEPRVELEAELELRELELSGGEDVSMATKLMLEVAGRALTDMGGEVPLSFGLTVTRSELEGVRSLADSRIPERVADAIVESLRESLQDAR